MQFVQELLQINEASTQDYQFKYDMGGYKDMKLPFGSLQNLADEIRSTPHLEKGINRSYKAYQALWAMILEYHGATKALDSKIFDVVDEDMDVISFDHDVLKISYRFTIRYGNDEETKSIAKAKAAMNKKKMKWQDEARHEKEPRQVVGKISIMPGN